MYDRFGQQLMYALEEDFDGQVRLEERGTQEAQHPGTQHHGELTVQEQPRQQLHHTAWIAR